MNCIFLKGVEITIAILIILRITVNIATVIILAMIRKEKWIWGCSARLKRAVVVKKWAGILPMHLHPRRQSMQSMLTTMTSIIIAVMIVIMKVYIIIFIDVSTLMMNARQIVAQQ